MTTDAPNLKPAIHAAEQARKHAELLKANPSQEQFHLDSIMELLGEMAKPFGMTFDDLVAKGRVAIANQKSPAPVEPDPEELWRQERGR